jgi:hypothetical protein
MAGTLLLGSYNDGAVRFEADYDDSLQITSFRCYNSSGAPAFGRLSADAGNAVASVTATYGQSFPSNPDATPTTLAVPSAPPNKRITLSANVNRPGRYTGYVFEAQVPG